MARRITIVPHDPAWEALFRAEAEQIRSVWGAEVVAVHHIGSTSVPGLSAKPIVDVLVEVRDVERIDAYDAQVERLGYLPKGENGIPGRRYFIKGDEERRSHHLHMFEVSHPEVARHLRFRDYLIAHPDEAQAYGRLKEARARQFPEDIEGYIQGKDGFIKEIDRKAALWKRES